MNTLFDDVELGPLVAPNRLVMAPMGRCRVDRDGVVSDLNAEYYVQRASAGLIVTEGTIPNEAGQGHASMARLETDDQVVAWRRVTDAVHLAGGRIFVQLLHWGRIGHPSLFGYPPVAPSPVRPSGQASTATGKQDYPVPKELTPAEITQTVGAYVAAASNAIRAGFDGVEIHGANGYLVHQFLSAHTNHRTDSYGGTVGNRIRFVLELMAALATEIGPERLGIRFSPGGTLNDIRETDADATYMALTRELAALDIAYLHLVSGTDRNLMRRIRTEWPGVLVVNPGTGALPVRETLDVVAEFLRDGYELLSFARQFIANPDLPERLRIGADLTPADPSTFYLGGGRGYVDYPALAGDRRLRASGPAA